ncbi:hypothetical protein V494_07365 [Pseudogymnoascus sp. VKM F-4513 (FW-928)]|nr:hypothetical protein V494_07365 [Pseudogymnoascus sp. VKM F-4513 (FW-928)]
MAQGWHTPPSNYTFQQMPLVSPVESTGIPSPFSAISQDTQSSGSTLFDSYEAERVIQPKPESNSPKPILPYPPSHSTTQHSRMEQGPSNRRTNSRIQRARRYRRIITQSSQYRAYRTKQDQQQDGQKWSADLEESFLDAFLDVPMMGKLMFQINGKPHGRNQLIALYMWIAYEKSLPPNVRPDKTKRRTQKQVSSHIQVLKGYIRTDPAFQHIFRAADEKPKCSNRDMLNNDPCLIALANNTLPPWRSAPSPGSVASIRPCLFDLYMSMPKAEAHYKRLHEYLDPEPLGLGPVSIDESLPNWRQQFPQIEQGSSVRGLGCSLIHVDVTLTLRYGNVPGEAELLGNFEIAVPANESHLQWRSVQTVQRHKDMFGSSGSDLISSNNCPLHMDRFEDGSGAVMRLAFPALPWTHALGRVDGFQGQLDGSQQNGHHHPVHFSAHQYIDQISMYQEIFSSADYGRSWMKRVILVWTFSKANHDDRGLITWRHIHTPPPAQALLTPYPDNIQGMQGSVGDHFNPTDGAPLLSIQPVYYQQPPSDLITPANSSAQQSPFSQYGNPTTGDIVPENMAFMSHNTQQPDEASIQTPHMNYMMNSDHANLHDFEQTANLWQPHPNLHRFENDACLSSYSNPTTTGGTAPDFKPNWRGPQELEWWPRPSEQPRSRN